MFCLQFSMYMLFLLVKQILFSIGQDFRSNPFIVRVIGVLLYSLQQAFPNVVKPWLEQATENVFQNTWFTISECLVNSCVPLL